MRHPPEPHAIQPPAGGPGPGPWVSLRRYRVIPRLLPYLMALALGGFPLLLLLHLVLREPAAGWVLVGMPLAAAAVALRVVPWLLEQGVEVTSDGIRVAWRPGPLPVAWRHLDIAWSDVESVVLDNRAGGSGHPALLAHVRQMPRGTRRPPWVRLVPAGDRAWGGPAARDRVVFDVGEERTATGEPRRLTELAKLLRETRPELFRGP